jgi:hypothetical protein
MSQDNDGYGARKGQSDIDRLLEDCRTMSPSSIERIARTWVATVAPGWAENVADHRETSSLQHTIWHDAERAALRVLETTNRARAWDELRNRVLDLTEHHDSLLAWRAEHGEVGHRAEDALLGAALALSARPELDRREQKTLLAPMAAALPWLLEE